MNKLVVNHLEKIIVTSDGATIVRELEVMHPAAKMIVLASEMQEKECGDGTSFVVTFAGELLKGSADLVSG
jgi:T-complex protein 1 subunit theta